MNFNPYLVLGVRTDATLNEIREKFYKLQKRKHPDKTKSNDAEYSKFLNKTWQILSDESLREIFDATLQQKGLTDQQRLTDAHMAVENECERRDAPEVLRQWLTHNYEGTLALAMENEAQHFLKSKYKRHYKYIIPDWKNIVHEIMKQQENQKKEAEVSQKNEESACKEAEFETCSSQIGELRLILDKYKTLSAIKQEKIIELKLEMQTKTEELTAENLKLKTELNKKEAETLKNISEKDAFKKQEVELQQLAIDCSQKMELANQMITEATQLQTMLKQKEELTNKEKEVKMKKEDFKINEEHLNTNKARNSHLQKENLSLEERKLSIDRYIQNSLYRLRLKKSKILLREKILAQKNKSLRLQIKKTENTFTIVKYITDTAAQLNKKLQQHLETKPLNNENLQQSKNTNCNPKKETLHNCRKSKQIIRHCNVCDKEFTTQQGFSRHQAIHKGIKKLLCQYCSKSFDRKDNWRRHQAIHLK